MAKQISEFRKKLDGLIHKAVQDDTEDKPVLVSNAVNQIKEFALRGAENGKRSCEVANSHYAKQYDALSFPVDFIEKNRREIAKRLKDDGIKIKVVWRYPLSRMEHTSVIIKW